MATSTHTRWYLTNRYSTQKKNKTKNTCVKCQINQFLNMDCQHFTSHSNPRSGVCFCESRIARQTNQHIAHIYTVRCEANHMDNFILYLYYKKRIQNFIRSQSQNKTLFFFTCMWWSADLAVIYNFKTVKLVCSNLARGHRFQACWR